MKISTKAQTKAYRKRRLNLRQEVTKQLRMRTRLEKSNFTSLRKLFNRNLRQIIDDNGNYNSALFIRSVNNDLVSEMTKHTRKVFETIIEMNIDTYEMGVKNLDFISFGRNVNFEREFRQYILSRSILYQGMSENLTRQVDTAINSARAQDLSATQTQKFLRQQFPRISRIQAARIARTETHNAASFASHTYNKKTADELDIKMLKKWVAVADERTRTAHVEANGQTVPMDEDFTIGGAKMEYAGDPKGGAKNVVNCRCVIVYVDEEDLENLTGDVTKPVAKPVEQRPDYLFDNEHFSDAANDYAFANSEADVATVVRNVGGIQQILNVPKKGAYYSGSLRAINMPAAKYKPNTPEYGVVWRHEFGHHIDAMAFRTSADKNKLLDFFASKKFYDLNAEELEMVIFNGHISGMGIKKFAKDRKKLLAFNKKQEKSLARSGKSSTADIAKELGIDQVESSWTSQYTGREFKEISYKYTIPFETAEKKFKTYIKGGFFEYDDLKAIYGDDFFKKVYADEKRLRSFIEYAKNNKYKVYNPLETNTFDFYLDGMDAQFKQEMLMFDDFVGSLTNAKYYTGHDVSYYRQFSSYKFTRGWTTGHVTEMMANYTSLMGGKNAKFWRKYMKELAPESLEFFDDIFNGMANVEGGFGYR